MSREKQLLKNTAIVAIGKICTQFISFFLLPLYTAMLSTEEYGTVDLLNTYISLLLPLIILQIDQGIFRFLIDAREDEKEKRTLISTTIIIITLQSVAYLIIYAIVGQFINNQYKYFLATNVVASIFSSVMLQISRGLGDNKTYSLGSLISASGTMILNVIFIVVFKWGAYGMLMASLIANCLCAMFVFLKKKLYKYILKNSFSKRHLRSIWKYSIPLVPNMLSWWIVNASDRTIVSNMINIGANGIYSAANKFSSVCITFFNIFNMTWSESASMYIKDKDSSMYFTKTIDTALRIFSAICIGIIAIMPFIFSLLINEKFDDAYYQIPILMMSTLCNIIVSLLGSVYVAKKNSREIAKTSILAAIINIVINLVLIKFIGLYAASISTLVAYLAMAIYRYIDVQKYIKIKVDLKLVLYTVLISIIIFTTYYMRITWLSIISLIITVLYAILINRNTMGIIVNVLKRKLNKN